MPSLPLTNAVVTRVEAPGFYDEYTGERESGALKWQGMAGAYLVEEVIVSTTAGRLDRFDQARLVLPELRDADRVTVAPEDVLEYRRRGETTTQRRVVMNVEPRGGHPGVPRTTRCYMRPA